MSRPATVLMAREPGERPATPRPSRRDALVPLLGPLGLAFLLVGGADLALTWYPLRIGAPDWELGTVMQTLNGLPVFALGLALLLAWLTLRGPRWAAVVLAGAVLLAGVAVVAMGALLGLAGPLALHAVQSPAILFGLKKALVKAAVQVVAYAALFFWVGARGLRQPVTSVERPSTA